MLLILFTVSYVLEKLHQIQIQSLSCFCVFGNETKEDCSFQQRHTFPGGHIEPHVPRGPGSAMRASRLTVLVVVACVVLVPAVRSDGDERLIGWLGEVERPETRASAGGLMDVDGDGTADTREQWIEQIATAPRAYVWHGFMTHEECDHVIATAEPLMEPSGVIDSKTGAPTIDPIRTSYGAFLPIGYDDVVQRIEKRCADWAMIPVDHQEQLHVLRYAPGQQYKDHHDAFGDEVKEKISTFDNGRQRAATILMYLDDVEEGGETVFPHVDARWSATADKTGGWGDGESPNWSQCASRGPAVRPKKGDALLFYDLNLKGEFENTALHAGCPVIKGTKWTATKWIHEQPYFNPKRHEARCADDGENAAQCPGWAERGECDTNPNFMLGTTTAPGECIASCCGGVGGRGRMWLDTTKAKPKTKEVCDLCTENVE